MASGQVAAATSSGSSAPQSPFNVTISPDAENLVVQPGGSVSETIQVRNNGLQTENLKATVMTFGTSGQNGVPQLIEPTPNDDFIHWLSTPTPTFVAEPNVWQSFKVTINPPKTAAFGYYYAIVFSQANQQASTHGNTLEGQVVSLILLDVKAPGEKRQASLTEFSTPNKLIEFLPENFIVRVHNTGNVHVAPRGNIFIYRNNNLIGLIQVNIAEGNILPGGYRVYTAQWTDGTPAYVLKRVNDTTYLNWNNFSFGKLRYGQYSAKLELIYNNGESDVPLMAQLSFWVMPWRIIAVLVFVLIVFVAGLWALLIRPLRGRQKRGRGGNARFR